MRADNKHYKQFLDYQKDLIRCGSSLNMVSYDFFIVLRGIECAMYTFLYPTTDFTDTAIMANYLDRAGDSRNRVRSMGLSWTRKVLSSVSIRRTARFGLLPL